MVFREILKARAAGYIAGYGSNVFKPDNYITRQEAVVIIAKVLNFKAAAIIQASLKMEVW